MTYVPPDIPALGGTTSSGSSGDLYLGVPNDYTTDYGGSAPISGAIQMRPDLYPVQVGPTYETDGPNTTSALAAIASLPPEAMARLQIRMARAGLIGPSTRVAVGVADDTTVGAYKELLGIANRYGMTDVDALSLLESKPGAAGATGASLSAGGGGGEKFDTTGSRTDTTYDHITPLDAKSLADQAYQDALGQDASPKQRRALRAALQAYAKANPTVATTDATYDPETGKELTSTTHSTGGLSAAGVQQIATDQARSAPDYAEIQASTTHFNWLQDALGATADVG